MCFSADLCLVFWKYESLCEILVSFYLPFSILVWIYLWPRCCRAKFFIDNQKNVRKVWSPCVLKASSSGWPGLACLFLPCSERSHTTHHTRHWTDNRDVEVRQVASLETLSCYTPKPRNVGEATQNFRWKSIFRWKCCQKKSTGSLPPNAQYYVYGLLKHWTAYQEKR